MKTHSNRPQLKVAPNKFKFKELRDIHPLDERRLDTRHRQPQDATDRLVNRCWVIIPALVALAICYFSLTA